MSTRWLTNCSLQCITDVQSRCNKSMHNPARSNGLDSPKVLFAFSLIVLDNEFYRTTFSLQNAHQLSHNTDYFSELFMCVVFLQIQPWLCAQTLQESTATTSTPTQRVTSRTVSDCSLSLMTVCTAHLSADCRHTNPPQLESLYPFLNILTEMTKFFYEIVLTERILSSVWMLVRNFSRLVALVAKQVGVLQMQCKDEELIF